MSTEEVKILSATVVEQGVATPLIETKFLSATVVEQGVATPLMETKFLSTTVVERPLDVDGLGQGDITKSPDYIVENGTPYVKFDPNTNDKQLFFYPSTEPKLREIKPVNYWRYFSTKGGRDRFADIYFQDENGVTIPGDYSVLGGSYYSSYTNANGLDGNPATAWISLGANGWVGKNFADPKLVKKYRIEALTNATYTDENPSSWRIEFSYDGVTWITADEVNLGRTMSPSEVYEGTLPNSALTTAGQYEIIALRPNLLDFYEAEQVFSGPEQLIAPHFNQVFMTDRTLEDAERNQIKSAMLARATGSGVDVEFLNTQITALSIVNPGAETGDTTGWTVSGGFATRSGAAGETPGAYEGTYYFYGGASTASSSAYQDMDVSASASSVNVTWQQSHYSGDDKANIRLEFYNLSSLVDVPFARYWRVFVTAASDSNYDGAAVAEIEFQSAEVEILTGTPISGPLYSGFSIANAFDNNVSTEAATDGGTLSGGTAWFGKDFGSAVQLSGYGLTGRQGEIYQSPTAWDLQYSSDGVSWTTFTSDTDTSQNVSAGVFYSLVAGTLLGSHPGPGLSAHTGGWLTRTTGNVDLPAETDTVRIIIDTQRFSGSNNDAYIDAISASVVATNPSENSVLGGLQDPYIPGFLGAPPPPGVATLLDSTKYTGSGNISQAHVFDPSTTLAVVVVNNVISTSGNPITPVMTINGEVATREASTYYSTGYMEGAFAFSVSNPSSGDIVYAGGAGESWMMTVYEFSNAAVGSAVGQNEYTTQTGSPVSTLSAVGDYVIHAITLGREDGETVTSFSGGAFESHDPAGAYYTGASAIVEDASGTYSWSFTGGADSYHYRVAIPILNA